MTCLISGCAGLYPEKAELTLHIDEDGSYCLDYKGIFMDYASLSDLAKQGRITKEHETKLSDTVKEARQDKRISNARYIGNGRVELEIKEKGLIKTGDELLKGGPTIYNVINLSVDKDKLLIKGYRVTDLEEFEKKFELDLEKAIKEENLDDEKIAEARKLMDDFIEQERLMTENIDWHISISTDAEVLEHNATTTPWFFGLFGAYEWEIMSPQDEPPYMLLQMALPKIPEAPRQLQSLSAAP